MSGDTEKVGRFHNVSACTVLGIPLSLDHFTDEFVPKYPFVWETKRMGSRALWKRALPPNYGATLNKAPNLSRLWLTLYTRFLDLPRSFYGVKVVKAPGLELASMKLFTSSLANRKLCERMT